MVRNTSGDTTARYLLSCHHVVFRSTLSQTGAADLTGEVFTIPLGDTKISLGKPSRPAPYGLHQRSIDAGLVLLDAGGMNVVKRSSYWKAFPTNYADGREQMEQFARSRMRLVSQLDSDVKLKYIRHSLGQEVENYAGAKFRIMEVVISETLASRHPASGDSGASILSGTILLSMHIAGDGPLSYSIPAYLLFSEFAFKPKLALATDEII